MEAHKGGVPKLEPAIESHKGGMPKLEPAIESHKGGMPKLEPAIESHKGGMPKLEPAIESHKGGMPKLEPAIESHKGGMPKLEPAIESHKGGMPKLEPAIESYTRTPAAVSGESIAQDVVAGAGRFARPLAAVGAIAAPLLDAYLMLLSYRKVDVDASAFSELSAEKLQPIVDTQLKVRSAEIAKVDAFYGVYANIKCELRYEVEPDQAGMSQGKVKLYDLRFLDMSFSAQIVNKAEWDEERGRKQGEAVQQVTLSILVYVPRHELPHLIPEQPEPTDPLYFSSGSRGSSLGGPQPVTTEQLLSWARKDYPSLFNDPRLSKEILFSQRFTGSQKAREKALNDLRRRVQERSTEALRDEAPRNSP